MLKINNGRHKSYLGVTCGHHEHTTPTLSEWNRACDALLGRAIRDLRTETVEQVRAALLLADAASSDVYSLLKVAENSDYDLINRNIELVKASEVHAKVVRRRAAEGEV